MIRLAVLLVQVLLRWAADHNAARLVVGLVAGLHLQQRTVGQGTAKTTGFRVGKVVAEWGREVCHWRAGVWARIVVEPD